mgnify:CR=1 FL=1
MKQFFIIKDNKNVGPMPADQLVQYGLAPNSLVWAEGMTEWLPASQVPELAQYLAPAQPQPPYQQPAAPAQPQPPYQQPVQQQQPYQQPMQPDQNPLANMTPQGIFKIILYLILAYTAIAGLINFIHSFDFFNIRKGAGPGLTMLFSTLLVMGICGMIILRMVKNERFGFLALGFFAITFVFALVDMIVFGSGSAFIMMLIAGILGMVCTVFAVVPLEKIGDPNSYKSLLAEAKQIDYIVLGVYAVLMLAFIILTSTLLRSFKLK